MRIDILTLFPEMFTPLDASILKRARAKGLLDIRVTNIRDYTTDKHRITDEKLYGGGCGMVLKPDPIMAAVAAINNPQAKVLVTSPAGRPFDQAWAEKLSLEEHLVIICGHYEGIDQRVEELCQAEAVSVGDYVLTGGEIPALIITDAVSRLLPGVLGQDASSEEESFSTGLLEYPQYTRPPEFAGLSVPEVLLNGNHAEITKWRRQKSLERTYLRRPELLKQAPLTSADLAELEQIKAKHSKPYRLFVALVHYPVLNKKGQIINTSLTNLDLHDIARAAATFGLSKYFLVQPILSQQELMQTLVQHWQKGYGARYNADRQTAINNVGIVSTLEAAVAEIEATYGTRPQIIATSAKPHAGMLGYAQMRQTMQAEGGNYLLLLGTGWGLTPETLAAADYILRPIYGPGAYNHLSVRSAAAIIMQRLQGETD